MSKDIDIEKLRSDLMDYYGTAMFNGFPMAITSYNNVQYASDNELIEIAKNNNFNLSNYEIYHFNDNNKKIKKLR